MAHIPWMIPPCRFLGSLTICSPHSPVIPTASLSPHMTSEERANSPRGILVYQQPNWGSSHIAWLQTWAAHHPLGTAASCPPFGVPGPSPGSLALASGWLEQVSQRGFPRSPVGKECNAGDAGSTLGSGKSPGEGSGNPLQYSCLEKPMDRGACHRLQSMGSHRVRHDWSDWAQEAWRLPCGPAKAASGPLLQRARPPMKTLWRLLYFRRHPVMRKWPRPYEWFFMKMKIEHIWLQKWYGGAADISREEYFRAVPRKAWWRERKVLSFYAGNLLRSAAGQRLTAVSLWKGSQQACHPDSEQDESRSPGTPVLAGEWSGRLQIPRSHRDSS